MNPRILKKLCKRADHYVGKLADHLERRILDHEDTIEPLPRMEKKYFERWNGKPNQHGYFIPLKNTIEYGCVYGYYEPEWEGADAYSHLKELVINHFTDWRAWNGGRHPKPTIRIKTPSDVFAHADALLVTKK